MDELEPGEDRTRQRFESVIAAAAPLLDLVLAVGERVSRLTEPTDYEYYPTRIDEPDDQPEPETRSGR